MAISEPPAFAQLPRNRWIQHATILEMITLSLLLLLCVTADRAYSKSLQATRSPTPVSLKHGIAKVLKVKWENARVLAELEQSVEGQPTFVNFDLVCSICSILHCLLLFNVHLAVAYFLSFCF